VLFLFRTYDIRGIYSKDLTPQAFLVLGKALEKFSKTLVAGMDYRKNNPRLLASLLSGFEGEAQVMGFAPTPAIAFNSVELGVSLTASHNPPEYNGLKPLKHKRSFFVEELAELKKEYEKRKIELVKPSLIRENLSENPELLTHYLDSLPEFGKAVFDLAGGAVCSFKQVFPKAIFDLPDPTFVRHSAEPTPDALGVLLSETRKNVCLGFAFDGDGDRCAAVDSGKIVDSGALAAFYASNHLAKGSTVVVTLDVQDEVFVFLQDNGFKPHYSAVGDVFVLKKAEELGADFAAEKGGHYSMMKHMPYSDGVYFSALLSRAKPGELNDFAKQFKSVFLSDKIENVAVDFTKLKQLVESKAPLRIETIDGVKASFDDYTFLIRASNTQPLVRISVEARDRQKGLQGLEFAKEFVSKCLIGR